MMQAGPVDSPHANLLSTTAVPLALATEFRFTHEADARRQAQIHQQRRD